VLLLDEIEKAHPDVFNVLLQVMDHGTLTDNNGRKADFRNVIIVMTTNAGRPDDARRPSASRAEREHRRDGSDIKRLFTPEFRNRLDAIVQFGALGFEDILRVVDKFLIELEAQLAGEERGGRRRRRARSGWPRRLRPADGRAPDGAPDPGHDQAPLADELLFGKLVNGGKVEVGVRDGQLTVEAFAEPEKLLPATVE
jgi:ATP-dependent Clp protease ATP-binding subunit ClpA